MIVVAILAIGPASDMAVAIVNRAVTRSLGPRSLPRLDLDDGVPSELRTLVAVPMMLTTVADVEEQVANLEVHYLGNREETCGSRCCPIGSMPTAKSTRATMSCSLWLRPASIDSTNGTAMPRGGALPALPPAPDVERRREPLDGLGAQARQAPGAECAVARIDDDWLPDQPGSAHGSASARALRRHAGRGYSTAAESSGDSSGRSPTRSTSRASIPGWVGSPTVTACCSHVSRPRFRPARTPRSFREPSPGPPASTRMRPLSRMSTKTSSKRAASPARGSTTSTRSLRVARPGPRQHAAQPRPVRGRVRRRPGVGHRVVR